MPKMRELLDKNNFHPKALESIIELIRTAIRQRPNIELSDPPKPDDVYPILGQIVFSQYMLTRAVRTIRENSQIIQMPDEIIKIQNLSRDESELCCKLIESILEKEQM